ncbi:MAG: ComF family protein [Holosporales bacterium]|jgi:ComF family protein|nr:ComF family protein [Holosporales bacterium]
MTFGAVKEKFLDILFPPTCALCEAQLQTQKHAELCGNCWQLVKFITKPYCKICGLPLDYGDDNQVCLGCTQNKHNFDYARAAVVYGAIGKDLILKFKHGDKISLQKMLANWLLRAISELPSANVDKSSLILAPVSLHWTRLLMRKYNQAALLAKDINVKTKIPCALDLLKRTVMTKSQGRLGLNQRRANVKNAFQLNLKYKGNLCNKTVLLVDDVFTTGSTLNECAKVLRREGAKEVHVATIARTHHPWAAS